MEKPKIKLFYAPIEQQYYIHYYKGFGFVLYRVENVSPLYIMPVESFGVVHTNDREIIKAVEEFAVEEFKKIQNDY